MGRLAVFATGAPLGAQVGEAIRLTVDLIRGAEHAGDEPAAGDGEFLRGSQGGGICGKPGQVIFLLSGGHDRMREVPPLERSAACTELPLGGNHAVEGREAAADDHIARVQGRIMGAGGAEGHDQPGRVAADGQGGGGDGVERIALGAGEGDHPAVERAGPELPGRDFFRVRVGEPREQRLQLGFRGGEQHGDRFSAKGAREKEE